MAASLSCAPMPRASAAAKPVRRSDSIRQPSRGEPVEDLYRGLVHSSALSDALRKVAARSNQGERSLRGISSSPVLIDYANDDQDEGQEPQNEDVVSGFIHPTHKRQPQVRGR